MAHISTRHPRLTRKDYAVILDTLDDAALEQLRVSILTEQERRHTIASAPVTMRQTQTAWAAAVGRVDGAAWTQPAGAHDAYRAGATVTHKGKVWVSLTDWCVWEPGVSGWREKTADLPEGPAEWVQPTGAHDAYPKGATVTHKGATWVATAENNTWEPGVYGWAKQ